MLSTDAIREFQEIYTKTYGQELSFVEATEQAARLIRLYKVVLSSSTSKQEESTNEHSTGHKNI